MARSQMGRWQIGRRLLSISALSPLGDSDLWNPMGSIGPQKSGRVARNWRFHQSVS
jgi:hypothetical protein